jgi:hypothetical protein
MYWDRVKLEFMRVLLLWSFVLCCSFSYASPILKGKLYKSGTVVSSEAVGISFTIPEGFSGKYDTRSRSFVIQRKDKKSQKELFSVYAFSKVDLKQITNYAAQSFASSGRYKLMPPKSQKTARGYRFQTSAVNRDGSFKLICESRKGSYGNGIVVFGLGNEDNPASLDQTINDILKTIKWSKPMINPSKNDIKGKCYTYSGFNKQTSRKEDVKIDLCNTGKFSLMITTSNTRGSKAEEVLDGQWELVNDLEGDTYLMLNGRSKFEFGPVEIKDKKIDFSGKSYRYKDVALCN